MARHYIVDKKLLSFAYQTLEQTSSLDDYKRALCVVLAGDTGLTTDTIANIMRINRSTVFRYRDEITDMFNGGEDPRLLWGGRRNSLLSVAEEGKILRYFQDKAFKGELVDIKLIHQKIEEYVGHSISLSSTYNLLHRNGWRKLSPDTCHPKCNPAVQEQFKKKFQKYWFPPSKSTI